MSATVALAFVAVSLTHGQTPPRPTTLAGRSTVYAPHAAIATSQPLATAAGLAVLERGGNAIDAAVTAAAMLAVVEPNMTGIGGDLFAMVWSAKDKRLYGLNASGRSGALMTRETLLERKRTRVSQGIESVTVPGALSGWAALLREVRHDYPRAGTRTSDRSRGRGISRHADHRRRMGRGGQSTAPRRRRACDVFD